MKWILYVALGLGAIVAIVFVIGSLLPKSHVASRAARYKQPPESIFQAITGPQDWRSDIKSREEVANPGGPRRWREIDSSGEAILYEEVSARPPEFLEVRIADPNLPFGGSWTYEIRPVAEGAALRITERGEVYNPIFRFVGRFFIGHTSTMEGVLRALGKKFSEEPRIEE